MAVFKVSGHDEVARGGGYAREFRCVDRLTLGRAADVCVEFWGVDEVDRRPVNVAFIGADVA
jgi:hypothetical protein